METAKTIIWLVAGLLVIASSTVTIMAVREAKQKMTEGTLFKVF